MVPLIPRALLWLFVINLGIALGAGLYEARIAVPQWIISTSDGGQQWDSRVAREANTGLRFWAYVTTVPLTLLTLASLGAAWWTPGRLRWWWLVGAVTALIDRVFTFTYFIPTMVGLMSPEGAHGPQSVATAIQWANLNHLRHAILLAAWLAALKALSLSGNGGHNREKPQLN